MKIKNIWNHHQAWYIIQLGSLEVGAVNCGRFCTYCPMLGTSEYKFLAFLLDWTQVFPSLRHISFANTKIQDPFLIGNQNHENPIANLPKQTFFRKKCLYKALEGHQILSRNQEEVYIWNMNPWAIFMDSSVDFRRDLIETSPSHENERLPLTVEPPPQTQHPYHGSPDAPQCWPGPEKRDQPLSWETFCIPCTGFVLMIRKLKMDSFSHLRAT